MRTCVVLGAEVANIPRELYTVTNDRAAIPTADLVIVDGVWFTRLRPLGGLSDDEAILQFLLERGILETSDLGRLNLDELAAAPGITRQPLHRFIRELSRGGRYPDTNRLQEFIIRRGIFI